MRYEDLLKEIGEFGSYQKRLSVILFLAGLPNAFFVASFTFIQYETTFRCRSNATAMNATENGASSNSSIYEENEWHWSSDSCNDRIGSQNLSIFSDAPLNRKIPIFSQALCKFGKEYVDHNTVIAEFDLVCDDSWKSAFAVTLYVVGMGCGALAARLSDRFGRRPIYLCFSYFQFAMAAFIGFAWNFESYAVGIFFMGTCGFTGYNIAVTLSTEMAGSKYQDFMANLNMLSYVFGFMLTPLISYVFPYWRSYMKFCGIIGLVYLFPLFFFFPESVRWQIVSGKTKDAKKAICAIAKANRKSKNVEEIYALLVASSIIDKSSLGDSIQKDNSLLKIYLHSCSMRKRLLSLNSCFAVASLLYFAISLYPISRDSSRYVHVLLVTAAEIPGYTFGFYTSRCLGGRWCCALSLGLAGLFCVTVPFVIPYSYAVLGIVTFLGKCFVACAYGYLPVTLGKISPTLVRHTSIGTGSAIAKLGPAVMPYLMQSGDAEKPVFSYVLMGFLGCAAALLVLLFVPDTRGKMPDTLLEAESNRSDYFTVLMRKFYKNYQKGENVQRKEMDEEFGENAA